MKVWLRRGALLLLALIVVGAGALYSNFWFWRQSIIDELPRYSQIADTEKGPIEYAIIGEGPPALALHSSPGGYDIVYNVMKFEAKRGVVSGVKTIIPSRPG